MQILVWLQVYLTNALHLPVYHPSPIQLLFWVLHTISSPPLWLSAFLKSFQIRPNHWETRSHLIFLTFSCTNLVSFDSFKAKKSIDLFYFENPVAETLHFLLCYHCGDFTCSYIIFHMLIHLMGMDI